MVSKWLHLNELGGDPWVLPIWSAVNASVAAKKVGPITKELGELGVHISTRLNLLPRVAARLSRGAKALYSAAATHKPEHEFTDSKDGVAFSYSADGKYELIADIDAFLFEVNSSAEIIRRLFQLLHAHAGAPIADDKLTGVLRDVLSNAGVRDNWFKDLDRNRNFVAHEGTPYLAVDISNNGRWDLLIMKENLRKFDEPKKFFTLSELQGIANGFQKAKAPLQKYLIELFK